MPAERVLDPEQNVPIPANQGFEVEALELPLGKGEPGWLHAVTLNPSSDPNAIGIQLLLRSRADNLYLLTEGTLRGGADDNLALPLTWTGRLPVRHGDTLVVRGWSPHLTARSATLACRIEVPHHA